MQQWRVAGRWAVITIAAALLTGAVGFAVGASRSSVVMLTATPDSAEGAISAEVGGYTYGIPQDVSWTDANGRLHQEGRPDCLPPTGSLGPVRFAAVEVTVEGRTWRPVVWVSCRQ